MSDKICYWDSELCIQNTRDASPAEQAEIDAARANASNICIPYTVDMLQARIALIQSGKFNMVQPAIDALPDSERLIADTYWNYANNVKRNDPFTLGIGAAIGLSSSEIDDLFIAASKI